VSFLLWDRGRGSLRAIMPGVPHLAHVTRSRGGPNNAALYFHCSRSESDIY
jgi:hypothetical protein